MRTKRAKRAKRAQKEHKGKKFANCANSNRAQPCLISIITPDGVIKPPQIQKQKTPFYEIKTKETFIF